MIFNGKRDLMSGFLHLAGMLLSIAALVVLVVFASRFATPWHVVSFSIYGVSLILLYAASTFYHIFHISDKVRAIFRKIDHMMIFVLIAGSYTPICLVPLRGAWGWSLFGCIWGFAILGIVFKIFWMNAPRILYTAFYIIMGWLAVIAIWPLTQAMPAAGLYWLVAGGLAYSLGGIIYALKWPKIETEWFGFHELFHIFILLGSLFHFFMMLFAVL